MAFWLSEANNVYNRIRSFYGSQSVRNLPTDESGVFKGYAGVTKTVCLVTIDAMRNNWGLDWYTSNNVQRAAAFAEIAADVWMQQGRTCDIAGIIAFENWCFVAAKGVPAILDYFAGGVYGDLTNVFVDTKEMVTSAASTAADAVKNILTTPSDAAGLVAKLTPAIKWAAIIWGASKIIKAIKA